MAELQARIYREMSPARKLAIVDDLIRTNRQLLWAGLKHRHPEETEARLERRLLGLVLGEDLATRAYGPLDDCAPDDSGTDDAA